MTPLGHTSVGFISGSKIKSLSMGMLIFGSLFPDFDFVFYFLANFNQFHRTFSHSILFFILVSIIVYIFSNVKKKKINAVSFLIGASLHVVIDACLDSNPSNGLGVMMFWPISKEYIYFLSPLGLEIDRGSWNNGVSFLKNNFIYILMVELPFWMYALILYKKKNNG